VLAEDGFADTQAQSGAAAGTLGGEKGVEDVGKTFVGDSRSVVLKDDPDGVGLAAEPYADRSFFAGLANGLVGVQKQIQKYLHELIGISHHGGDRGIGQEIDRDIALAQWIRLDLNGTLYEFIQVHRAASGGGRTGEVLKVLHDLGGAPGLLVENCQLFAGAFADIAFLEQFCHS